MVLLIAESTACCPGGVACDVVLKNVAKCKRDHFCMVCVRVCARVCVPLHSACVHVFVCRVELRLQLPMLDCARGTERQTGCCCGSALTTCLPPRSRYEAEYPKLCNGLNRSARVHTAPANEGMTPISTWLVSSLHRNDGAARLRIPPLCPTTPTQR